MDESHSMWSPLLSLDINQLASPGGCILTVLPRGFEHRHLILLFFLFFAPTHDFYL